MRLVAPLVVDYSASRRLVVDYFAYAACPGASARCARGSSRRSSSTTPPPAGSSLTTSPPPRVGVPRHVAPLVVDYSASRRLVVDYFAYVAHPVASARRVARCRLLRLEQARRRLLRLRRASGCLSTSRGSLRGSSSTTSTTPRVRVPRHVARLVKWLVVNYFALSRLVVDYFAYAARPGASARRAACRAARRAAHRRLLRLRRAPPRRRLLVASRQPFISTSFPN
jgi:hypothetical protein